MNIIGAHPQSIGDVGEVTCSPCYHLAIDTEVSAAYSRAASFFRLWDSLIPPQHSAMRTSFFRLDNYSWISLYSFLFFLIVCVYVVYEIATRNVWYNLVLHNDKLFLNLLWYIQSLLNFENSGTDVTLVLMASKESKTFWILGLAAPI